MSGNESSQISSPSQKFVPQEGDEEELWEVIEITGEKKRHYKVRWKGIDPKTMKPWAQSWVPKSDCTDDLVMAWKRKQRDKEKRKSLAQTKKRDSIASKSSKPRESTTSTTTKSSSTKARSSRSDSATTVKASKTRASGSIKTVIEEDESSSEEGQREVNEQYGTISKPKTTGNKRKHAEVSSTHTSANVGVIDVIPNEEDDVRPQKTGRPMKKRKLDKSSPIKTEMGSPVGFVKTLRKPPAPPPVTLPVQRSESEASDVDDARLVEQDLSNPGVPSNPGDVEPINKHHQGSSVAGPSKGPSKSPAGEVAPTKNQPTKPAGSSNGMQPPQAKPAPITRKDDSKSSILEGRKRVLTKKRPAVVTSDSDEQQEQRLLLRRSSSVREHTTPVQEASVFWDGEDQALRPVLSPRANRRLSIFDREIREVEEELNALQLLPQSKAQIPDAAHKRSSNNSPDFVPETEMSSPSMDPNHADTSPTNSPPKTPPKSTNTLKAKMQGRTPLSKHSSFNKFPVAGPSRKALRPIPTMPPEVFYPYLQNSIPETIEEDSSQPHKDSRPAAADDAPLSSIEQFDTPEKSKSSKSRLLPIEPERIAAKDKGKKPHYKEPSATEIWESDVVQKGQQIAAAAKKREKERELVSDAGAEGAGADNLKRRSLLDIAQVKAKAEAQLQPSSPPAPPPTVPVIEEVDEDNTQMDDISTLPIAPSSHPPATAPEPETQLSLEEMHEYINFDGQEEPVTIDPKLLRQEEEESTLDLEGQQKEDQEDQPAEKPSRSPSPAHTIVQHESQLSYSQPGVPASQPVLDSHPASLSENRPDIASIPHEREDIIPPSQDHSQHYGMSESLAHPMDIDVAGPSGLGASIASHISQDLAGITHQWETERANWHIDKLSLHADVEALRLNLKSAEKDREFFREQYSRASAFVTDTIAENKELKQRAEIAEGQAKEGVKFVREVYEARVQMLEEDVKHWRNTAQFLIEKDRMTNDEVRRRAAEEPEVRKKLAEERENVFLRDKRIYDMEQETKARNSEMEKEIALWKSQAEVFKERLGKAHHKLDVLGKAVHEDEGGDGHECVYRCFWRMEGATENCQASFSTFDALFAHADSHLLTP